MVKKTVTLAIKLADNTYIPAQILVENTKTILCLTVAIFQQRVNSVEDAWRAEMTVDQCISLVLSTTDLLDYAEIFEGPEMNVKIEKKFYPYRKELRKDGVGIKMYKPAILVDFVNAYHGIIPWDHYHDPLYFEKLLLSESKRPENLIFEKS